LSGGGGRWLLPLAILMLGAAVLLGQVRQAGSGAARYQPAERVAGGNQAAAPRVSPQSEQLDARALQLAADYAGAHGARALIVSRHGYIVFERYWDGSDFDTPEDAQGFTPLLAALATGVALSHRLIGYPDEPLSALLPQWPQDARGSLTLRNLLQSSSGLGDPPADAADISAALWHTPLVAPPGSVHRETAADAQLLAQVLERASQKRYADYLSQTLWRRLGAADAWLWLDHPGGSAHAECCLMAHQGDWIRVAELLLSDGRYQGAEVIRPGWIALLRAPAKSDPDYGAFMRIANQPRAGQEAYATRDLFAIGGAGGNRLWLAPGMQVAVLLSAAAGARAADWDDSRIPNLILRGARDYQPPPAGDLSTLVPGH
jgi:CubicO group peptidase (beta-lactamase class C family)